MFKGKEKILLFIALMITAAGGYFIGEFTAPKSDDAPTVIADCQENMDEKRVGGFKLINPLLECDNYQPSHINSVVRLETDVQDFIQQVKDQKKATFVSVYFRDLNFGPWMGINEKENFAPASLLKVPIMIAALKKAEEDRSFLQKKVKYTEHLDKNVVPNILDTHLVKLGNSYTIEDLIERMIEYSDNEAKELLLQNLDQSFILKVMSDIGINTSVNMSSDFVSVRDYSNFFRLLYNATYLDRDLSEKALQILSKTKYDKGFLAGLPKGTMVAHKFGERAYTDSDIKQLHECGIVYFAGSPYLLCIMTRGTDFDQLATVLAGISAIVYKDASAIKN